MPDKKYLKPLSMLVCYENNYAEYHQITNGIPDAGRPASISMLKEFKSLLENVSGLNGYKGLVSDKLIYIDSDPSNQIIIWETPKMKRKLTFLKFNGIAEVPAMLWKLSGDNLCVYFLKENIKGTTKKFELYTAGFPNISTNGSVCFGNVSFEPDSDMDINEIIEHTENCFFNSVFTDEVNVCEKDTLLGTWSDIILGNPNPFPFEILPKKVINIDDLW